MAGPEDDKPRIFLSYTRDPESDDLREAVERALAGDFDHWRGVPPAEEAAPARDRYLGGAQGAVVIVSPLALESEWMQEEARLLQRRALADPRFVVVWMATRDVDPSVLQRMVPEGGSHSFVVDPQADPKEQIGLMQHYLSGLVPAAQAAPADGASTLLHAAQHMSGVHAVALTSLDGRPCVVTGDGLGTLRVIEIATDALRLELGRLHAGFVSAIAVGSRDGVPISVSGGYDGMLRVVDLVDARVIGEQHLGQGAIGGIALLDESLVVAGGSDGSIHVWDMTRGAIGERPQGSGHQGPVRSVAAARLADGRPVAISGGEDRRVRLWDVASVSPRDEPRRGHTGIVQALAVAQVDGRPVAVSGGAEGTLRLWELADGGPLGEPLQAHPEGVLAVAAATLRGRPVAVSGGADGAIRAWDLRTRQPIAPPLLGHEGPVGAVALSGTTIASGGQDSTVRVWDLPGAEDTPAGDGVTGADPDDRVEWVSDARAKVDLLQRAPLAHAIATRLRRLREEEPGRSFLIHVDGRWGSGKSTLLDLLRKDLAEDWLIVEFDAWRQMRVGPPWWALLASLRQAVRRDMGFAPATRLRIAESMQRVRRGGALYVLVVAALLALVLATALLLGASLDIGATGKLVSSIVAITGGIAVLYAAMSAVGRFLLWDSAAGARVFEQSHRDPMESVADHFAWLINRAGRPVVFFVDDLDRCADEYVVDLLDSVQTLIRDAPGRLDAQPHGDRTCYVVVAADGRWIRTSYEHAHGEFVDAVEEPGRPLGYLFLDKIFQLTVPVPTISPQRQAAFLQALLHVEQDTAQERRLDVEVRDVAERVEESTTEAQALEAFDAAPPEVRAAVAGTVVGKLAQPQIQAATEHRLERFAGLLETNPRAMKLVLNAYGMARALQVIEDNVVPGDALALWTILRVRWPALADHLRAHPESIDALAEGTAPQDAPPALARLFCAPAVRRVVECADGGPLDAATIRACCGIASDGAAAVTPPPPAGTP